MWRIPIDNVGKSNFQKTNELEILTLNATSSLSTREETTNCRVRRTSHSRPTKIYREHFTLNKIRARRDSKKSDKVVQTASAQSSNDEGIQRATGRTNCFPTRPRNLIMGQISCLWRHLGGTKPVLFFDSRAFCSDVERNRTSQKRFVARNRVWEGTKHRGKATKLFWLFCRAPWNLIDVTRRRYKITLPYMMCVAVQVWETSNGEHLQLVMFNWINWTTYWTYRSMCYSKVWDINFASSLMNLQPCQSINH